MLSCPFVEKSCWRWPIFLIFYKNQLMVSVPIISLVISTWNQYLFKKFVIFWELWRRLVGRHLSYCRIRNRFREKFISYFGHGFTLHRICSFIFYLFKILHPVLYILRVVCWPVGDEEEEKSRGENSWRLCYAVTPPVWGWHVREINAFMIQF